MTTSATSEQLHLGRQPILDRNKLVVAFELLFRNGQVFNVADHECDSTATIKVISNAFNELGMDSVLGNCLGFINVNEAMLFDDVIELLPKEKTVFEILETVEITEEIIARCRQLKSLGYKLALDDVIDLNAASAAILPYIDIIKIDILDLGSTEITALMGAIKSYNPKLTMLAEKVETLEQFEFCLQLGFDLFQGYFFAKPQIISGRRISIPDLSIMRLMGEVMADSDLNIIEKTIKENAALSFSLLKFSNSAAVGSTRTISSIKESVTLLGRRQLQRWIQLLLYANGSGGQDKISPLQLLAASRGRTMGMIAKAKGENSFEDHAFLTGILSLIDTLLGMPIDQIIIQIKLDPQIVAALLNREGELGKLLQLVEHFEQDNEDGTLKDMSSFPYLSHEDLKDIHADSLLWANAICQGRS
jgi:EAL and modified HD-GYP domain-containing signal transduction protein